MSPPRLPPNAALRAFEAAARHVSFRRAAEELRLTESAVSHQVRHLEETLGLKLFERHPRGLSLTEAGSRYFAVVREALDRIASATVELQGGAAATLRVSALTAFAVGWLIPRLKAFQARHPNLDLDLQTSDRVVDLRREKIDVALRYGSGPWPGLQAVELVAETLQPLCAPALAAGLREPADLLRQPLLRNTQHPEEWGLWLAGVGLAAPEGGPGFESSTLVLEAATQGLGVALGRRPLSARKLAAGELVAPFPRTVASGKAYWFVCLPEAGDRPAVARFRDWLVESFAAEA